VSKNSGGMSGITLLQIVFITLKPLDVIDWSWWWVLAPLWGSLRLAGILLVLVAWLKTTR